MDYLKNLPKIVHETLKDTYKDIELIKKTETTQDYQVVKVDTVYTIKGLKSEFSSIEHLAGIPTNKVKFLILIESLPENLSIEPKDEINDNNYKYIITGVPTKDASQSIYEVEVERI